MRIITKGFGVVLSVVAESNLVMAAYAGDWNLMTGQEPYQRNRPSGLVSLR